MFFALIAVVTQHLESLRIAIRLQPNIKPMTKQATKQFAMLITTSSNMVNTKDNVITLITNCTFW